MNSPSTHKRLPERGPKKLHPDDDIPGKNIAQILLHEKSLHESEYVRSRVAIAEYNSETKQVKVKKVRGKMFQYMGHQNKSGYFLHPEEAIFMMESNELELRWNSCPLSLQKAYAILLGSQNIYANVNSYKIFQNLISDGFVVIRHRPNESSLQPSKHRVDSLVVNKDLNKFKKQFFKTGRFKRQKIEENNDLQMITSTSQTKTKQNESKYGSHLTTTIGETPAQMSWYSSRNDFLTDRLHEKAKDVCRKKEQMETGLEILKQPQSASVCESLQNNKPLENLRIFEENARKFETNETEHIEIIYDAFDRDKHAKLNKSAMPWPADFSVTYVRPTSSMPTSFEITSATKQANELVFCLDSTKGPSYYNVKNVVIEDFNWDFIREDFVNKF